MNETKIKPDEIKGKKNILLFEIKLASFPEINRQSKANVAISKHINKKVTNK